MKSMTSIGLFSSKELMVSGNINLEIEVWFNKPNEVFDIVPIDEAKEQLLKAAQDYAQRKKLKYMDSLILPGGSYTKKKVSIVVQFNNPK